jgi:glycosyltransferase involved in cell wall biosynthesis
MAREKFSTVIIVKNESSRIRSCLDRIAGWTDEIVIIDDESTDNTRDICAEYGAKVFIRKMDIEGLHRNWAYAKAAHDRIFSLDADEHVTDELKAEIDAELSRPDACDLYTMPRKNHIGAYWLRYGGQYPLAQVKVFRRSKFRFDEQSDVHPRAYAEGTTGRLKSDLLHYTYRDLADAFRKLNNQTTLEAIKWTRLADEDPKKASAKMNLPHALWRTADRFFRAYVTKQGWRDGFRGFILCWFGGIYQLLAYAKYAEMRNRASGRWS